jgi:hypothetical protein
VSGILPRFFATGKPLSQGYLIKMKIGDVFPPHSGFVQQGKCSGSLTRPLICPVNCQEHLSNKEMK